MLDGLQEILFTLRQNKLRTVLTAFGVFWGIFMLILLLGFGRGMQNGVFDDFGSDVLDSIAVWSGDTSVAYRGMGPGRHIQLDQADVQALARQVSGIRLLAGGMGLGNGTVTFGEKHSNSDLQGIPDEFFKVKEDVPFNLGRRINPLDLDEVRKIVVIGTSVVERLFPAGVDPVGQDVRVKDVVMKVVGVFHDKGNRGRASESVYMPLSTARKIYGGGARIDSIMLRPAAGVDGFALEQRVVELLKRRHDVSPDDKRGVNSFNMAMPMQQVTGLFIGINVFIWFVGLGTLTAGIVGISNIMIITVKERTREIGIRKALGAKRRDILWQFLTEAMTLTGVGGLLGIAIGGGFAVIVNALSPFPAAFQPAWVALAFTSSLIVGLFFGLWPAWKASNLDPIDALRYE